MKLVSQIGWWPTASPRFNATAAIVVMMRVAKDSAGAMKEITLDRAFDDDDDDDGR